VGAVVRDVGAPSVGDVPVQRRYELELTGRPLGTDRLDLGLGGRIGERRADVDGWLRVSARLTRGVYAHLAAETRELQVVDLTPSGGQNQFEDRDLRVVAGLELSFGATGVTAYGAAGVDEDGAGHLSGATIVLRASTQQVPPVQGHATRLERVDLQGAIGAREAARLVLRLRAMARDPDVAGLVLAIDGITAGWGTVQELRGEVTRLRAAGKKVFAYLVVGANRDYYLATAADKIYIDPAGGVRLTGLAATTMYFRGAFDMLGVSAQFEKIAEYKSAPESYTDVGPSEPARRMRDELYDSIYDQLVAGIASGRGLDPAVVRQLIEDGPYSAGDLAKDKRLVDAVGVPDEISQQIVVELGASYPVAAAPSERDDRWDRPAVAIIYADGDIVDGKSSEIPLLGRKLVGGETLIGALQAARLDPSIKAIVLRIDSPGGSALASELMAREVFKTRGVKPIICSMGDVAASGGYFLAAGCDKIFAEPMTITGSIGIFYGKFDLSGLIAKLGITTTTFTRGRHADMDGYYRGYTDEERALIQDKLRYLYGRFTGTVAEGRGLTVDQVDQVGRGHVWSGTQARGVGLVDELGGLGDALDYAKAQAGLGAGDRVRVVELPEAGGGLLSKLIGNLLRARAADHVALSDVGLLRQLVRGVPASVLVAPETPQARLPFDITWE
ncbi:MAG: signal peptide peptidase SppA, partial [Candidatus Competibacteraceae bacterium]|nr:signal peptide peptidase SppA [Candidatus Competibacteraceae bacterium]